MTAAFGRLRPRSTASSPSTRLETSGTPRRQRQRLFDGERWERVTPRVARLVGSTRQRRAACPDRRARCRRRRRSERTQRSSLVGHPRQPARAVSRRSASRPLGHAPRGDRRHEPTTAAGDHVVVLDGIPTQVPARALFDVAGTQRRGASFRGSSSGWNGWWTTRGQRASSAVRPFTRCSTTSPSGDGRDPGHAPGPGYTGLDYIPPASNLEARVIKILADGGLPPMRRQVDTGDGRVGSAASTCATELPLILEVQSERFHSSQIDRQLDARRIERLERAGLVVVAGHRRPGLAPAKRGARRRCATVADARLLVRRAS